MWTPVIKELTIDELKSDYSNRHGFVFQSNMKTSDDKISQMCETLIQNNFTSEYPEFVVLVDTVTTVFVYLGEDFHAPKFMNYAMLFNKIGIGKVNSIVNTFAAN